MNEQLTLNIDPGVSEDELKDMIERSTEEEQDASPSVIPPPDIVAFNEQRSCADIHRMCKLRFVEPALGSKLIELKTCKRRKDKLKSTLIFREEKSGVTQPKHCSLIV